MTKRINHSTGSEFETKYGYSRAVQVGNRLWIAGTIGYDYATMLASDNICSQTRQCMDNIHTVLANLGAGFDCIVHMDVYVTSAGITQDVLQVLRPFMPDTALTVVVVRFSYDPIIQIELRPYAVLLAEE
jgi:enamine deaminase RidA (YjgF/YER057c/UK114 family)